MPAKKYQVELTADEYQRLTQMMRRGTDRDGAENQARLCAANAVARRRALSACRSDSRYSR